MQQGNDVNKSKIVNELVSLVKGNDTSAFLELLGLFSHTISLLASSFGLPQSEHEDLCQEGRMALYRACLSYDENNAQFSTYAASCMTNAMINFAKKYNAESFGAKDFDEASQQMLESDSAEAVYFANSVYGMLREKGAMGLSSYELKVMSLAVSGHKTGEIAKKLGKSTKSVENTLFRARKKLKGVLDK